MEREIEFRGKTKNGNKWIYGDLLHPTNTLNNKYAIFEIGGGAIIVVPKTIGQFTGLLDKGGKKIYEGDIVKVNGQHIDVVIYANGCFCMDRQYFNYEFTYQDFDRVEVIGNIYDNKDLLD